MFQRLKHILQFFIKKSITWKITYKYLKMKTVKLNCLTLGEL